jgi:NRPS condensation-like uncharacterized protein
VAVAARIIGEVTEKDLRRALDAVRRNHPLLGAKVIFNDHHDAWFSTDKVPETRLRIVPRRSETQWFEEIRYEHKIPFEPEIGPLIRFALVYSPQVSELVIFANHSICDGKALAILVRDILEYYANPEKEVQIIQSPTFEDCLPKERMSLSGFIKKIVINHYNRQWRKRPYYFTQADFNQIHKAHWDMMQYNVTLIQLEPEETATLVAKCRENNVTVTSASTAAFLAAYRDILGPFPKEKNGIWIAYDLRRHLRENIGDVIGTLAGAIQFKFDYNQNKPLWKNAQEIHRIIRKDMERFRTVGPEGRELLLLDPTLIDALNFAPFTRLVPEAFERTENLSAFARDTKNVALTFSRKGESGILGTINTNLGRLDFPLTFGDLQFERMFFVPAANSSVPLILGGVSVRGKLVFSLNYAEEVGGHNSLLTQDMVLVRNRALELLGFPEKTNDRAM